MGLAGAKTQRNETVQCSLEDRWIEYFNEVEESSGQRMKSFECIAKKLGYYFTGDGEVEFLTPFDYEI